MIPQERGLEGISIYFIFYLPIFVLMENISYMSFLGEGHVVLNSKKYINPSLVCLGVSSHSFTHSFTHCSLFTLSFSILSPFILSPTLHSSFILILAWERKMNCGEEPWFGWM
jgi:hypothetical protein